MSTQQDIYAVSSENRPPMLNKENYVPWSSRLLRYAKSRPNGKLIYNSIINGLYVRRMIPEPGDANREVPVNETFLTKQMMNLLRGALTDWSTGYKYGPRQIDADGWRNQVVQNLGVQNVGNQNGLIVVPRIANQNPNRNGNVVATRAEGNEIGNNGNKIRCYNCRGLGHLARNCIVRPRRRDAVYLQTQLLIAQKEEAGIQLQAEEFDLMAAAADLDEIEEVNVNCILMANLQQASTSGTQTDKAPVYDSDGSTELHHYDNCYNNDIFNMFTQEEQYTELLKPIHEPHQVQQNDSNVIYEVSTAEVEKVNTVNRKMKEINVEFTTELARYNNQEKCFEISQEKYDKLERCYQKSVYQEQFSKEKSIVSSLLEEKKKLKSDFKIREDELLDKQIQLETKIKELDNILVKTAQQKQQSLYNGKVLLEKHDPPAVYDSEETLELAQEKAAKFVQDFKSLANEADESIKQKALELEIERLLREVASQDIMSIVENATVVETFDLQTELEQCKYDKIPYDKAYNDMQQKIERLQAQLGDLKGKSNDNPCVSNTLDPLSKKLENENVELEFQVFEQKDTTKVNTAKTKRPQPRSNTKNDRVPFVSKSSCIQNKEVKVEEHPRNLLLSKNKKHMSSECNNVKLAIRNDKFEVICAMYKQCLITANHDVCVLNYVNDMNSRGKKQQANVSNYEN
ncbi:retrovirus-related pol polyprotein from transposon TNT 1-94 [Tanacetum coccineum]